MRLRGEFIGLLLFQRFLPATAGGLAPRWLAPLVGALLHTAHLRQARLDVHGAEVPALA